MPADPFNDAVRMVGCGLAVAAAAAPVGLLGWLLARRAGVPVLPRPQPWRVPWTGFEVVVAFLVVGAVIPGLVSAALAQGAFYQSVYGPTFPPVPPADGPSFEASAATAGGAAAAAARGRREELATVRSLWVGLIAFPLQLGLLALARQALYPHWRSPADPRAVPARVALAVAAWAILTPLVLAVHAAANLTFVQLDWLPEDHPLSQLSAARPALDHALFVFQACVAAPVVEEVLFRGVLLAWLVGGKEFFAPAPGRPRFAIDRRAWPVLALGVPLAAATVWTPGAGVAVAGRGPVLFAAALAVGWLVLRKLVRTRRTAGAVYASAALFAVVHSAVWPSPVPLFALGLGLGWLAVRTRGVLAPVIVHGLFNAVSVLFVLRSGAG